MYVDQVAWCGVCTVTARVFPGANTLMGNVFPVRTPNCVIDREVTTMITYYELQE